MASKLFCDKCDGEIIDNNDVYTVQVLYLGFRRAKQIDLCGKCANNFNNDFLGNKRKIWYTL